MLDRARAAPQTSRALDGTESWSMTERNAAADEYRGRDIRASRRGLGPDHAGGQQRAEAFGLRSR